MQSICLKKLAPQTRLTVETRNSIYQIVLIENDDVTIMGGWLPNGEIRYPIPVQATFIGSLDGNQLRLGEISYNSQIQMLIDKNLFRTSTIRNVEVEAPNSSWSYRMDWGKM